jgi:peptidoglycan L-alanyl-D-glutamate endopeptidase CwlK
MEMAKWKFSKRSLQRLEGVKPELVEVTKTALELSSIDFGITCGLRTVQEQRALVAKGASKTMKSKHITGDAVDVVAYIGKRISWELSLYDNIADAFKAAAMEHEVRIRWGAAWNIPDIREWDGTMQDAMNYYIDARRSQGRRPFIDGPHFELN